MKDFDIIVIGSGLGGLISANLLALEGFKVCVLEKNKQVGGALQVYVRNRVIFDTGVHYIGGLDPGQNLYQIFRYLGLNGKLNLKRMGDVFDRILIGGDEREYRMGQGYDKFIDMLAEEFPEERAAIENYVDKIRDVCLRFPLYNLRSGGNFSEKSSVMEIDTQQFIETITDNRKLQAVLAGNNMLYAGQGAKTPFYVHALIINSYIESSWKCIDGGSQIAKILSRNIHGLGGVVKIHKEVKKLVEENGRVTAVELSDGSHLQADSFISNVHPAATLSMIDSNLIRSSFRNRIGKLENSVSSFTVDIILKPGTFPALESNYYYHDDGRIWDAVNYDEGEWPLTYGLFSPYYSKNFDPLSNETATSETINGNEVPGNSSAARKPGPRFARSLSILTYMKYSEVAQWADTFNTVSHEASRGEDYERFKTERAEKLIDRVAERFPSLRDCIERYYTSTPLSYRDYMGTTDGTMYGIAKDFQDPMKTLISTKTKIPNLYFTGQNLNMHGVLGVAMTAIQTAVAIMGNEEIVDKIRNA